MFRYLQCVVVALLFLLPNLTQAGDIYDDLSQDGLWEIIEAKDFAAAEEMFAQSHRLSLLDAEAMDHTRWIFLVCLAPTTPRSRISLKSGSKPIHNPPMHTQGRCGSCTQPAGIFGAKGLRVAFTTMPWPRLGLCTVRRGNSQSALMSWPQIFFRVRCHHKTGQFNPKSGQGTGRPRYCNARGPELRDAQSRY